jgi:septum formation protein
MMKKVEKYKIILASSSPRRKYLFSMLLKNFGLKFEIKPANIEEYIHHETNNYSHLVKCLSFRKARIISLRNEGIILGADTIVVIEDQILGKPVNKSDAKKMLVMLSGKWHKVYSGISFINNLTSTNYSAAEMTRVKFRQLEKDEIEFYVNSGSPFDKAGSYGIQDDFGSTFVEKISGDYFNVVGLPIVKTYIGLKKVLNFTF